MSLQINCVNPQCRKSLQVDVALAARQVRCPACGQVMVAPAGNAPTPQFPVAELAAPLPTLPAAPPPASVWLINEGVPINIPISPPAPPPVLDAIVLAEPPLPEATAVVSGSPVPQARACDDCDAGAVESAGCGAAAKRCPKCETVWPHDAALCVNCGYDFRTGRKRAVVKSREVRRSFPLNAFRHLAVVLLVLGGLFVFFALLGLLVGSRPLLALLCLLPSLAAVAAGIFLLISCTAKVCVYQHRDGHLVCAIHYLLGKVSYWRNEKYVLPGDKFVITHETHPMGIIILLFLLLCLVVPGILWWWLLLKRRTMLTIENDVTGRRQGFSLFWDDDAIRDLISAVQEVEQVELVRR